MAAKTFENIDRTIDRATKEIEGVLTDMVPGKATKAGDEKKAVEKKMEYKSLDGRYSLVVEPIKEKNIYSKEDKKEQEDVRTAIYRKKLLNTSNSSTKRTSSFGPSARDSFWSEETSSSDSTGHSARLPLLSSSMPCGPRSPWDKEMNSMKETSESVTTVASILKVETLSGYSSKTGRLNSSRRHSSVSHIEKGALGEKILKSDVVRNEDGVQHELQIRGFFQNGNGVLILNGKKFQF